MSTDEQKVDVVMFTHLLSWLPQAYDHCQFGSREWCDSYLNNAVDTITALQERIKELELHTEQLIGLLEMLKEHWIEYDHVFSISVHEARSTLKDSGNGSEVAR